MTVLKGYGGIKINAGFGERSAFYRLLTCPPMTSLLVLAFSIVPQLWILEVCS